ncbi:MAG: MFS transporter [Deltaproteobacteria bacterium]|nr:MFS transporter [Deltaproteobacteria bacterium]
MRADHEKRARRVSLGTHIGYGVAGIGENTAYNIYYLYFIFFLTTVSGINPAVAGTIAFIAVLWDAFTDPAVGYISDHLRSKHGRRRPFMVVFIIPFGIVIGLLFTNATFLAGWAKIAYYLVINILFWVFFTSVDIPYVSLGAEITTDFAERSKLRTIANIFMNIGSLLAFATTMIVVEFFTNLWGSKDAGWSSMAVIFALITVITYLLSWKFTKGKEAPVDTRAARQPFNLIKLLKEYVDVIKNRPVVYIVAFTLLICGGTSGMAASSLAFYGAYNLGLDEMGISKIFLCYSVGVLVLSIMVGFVGTKFSSTLGKGKTLGCATLIAGVGLIFTYFLDTSLAIGYAVSLLHALGQAGYWVFNYAMAYDCAVADEHKYGKKREGTVVAVISFFYKLATAVGMWLTGIILQYAGFNAEAVVQTPNALHGIQMSAIFLPGIAIFLCSLLAFKYPLTQAKFDELQKAIAQRKAGA